MAWVQGSAFLESWVEGVGFKAYRVHVFFSQDFGFMEFRIYRL